MEKIIKKPEKIFLLLAPIFIGFSLLLMPINRVPDEASHARMSWAILHEKTEKSIDWQGWDSKSVVVDRNHYAQLFKKKLNLSNEKIRIQFPLNEIMHVPQLIGMTLGQIIYPSTGVLIMCGRIVNALFYITMMYFIIKFAKYGKLALLFISLLPIMVQQVGSLSYDVVNFILIFGFFAVLSDLFDKKRFTKTNAMMLLIVSIGLCITKINNVFLLALLLTLNVKFEGKLAKANHFLDKLKHFVKKYKYVLGSVISVIILLLAIVYFKNKGGIIHFTQVMLNTVLDNNLNPHLNTYLTTGMFGYLGIFDFQLPMWLIIIDIAVLTMLLVKKENIKLNKAFGLLSGIMFPLQVMVIIGGMYFEWTPRVLGENAIVSQGAQGRYFTPFLIYLAPFFISIKDKITIESKKYTLEKVAIVTLVINFLITLYLIILIYWYPSQEAEWLLNLRRLIGR